ncbi:V/A-type H+-transporting ATPase subunit F [Peptoclostridium litorale DSM 5388]|uniref:Vacuolar H+-transporting two-sector ATPase, F subunit n=1 Tax=Peptoclostridium litorale DSM 5388 TaxID=1121324 RepID=A0A069RF00_PEPLI|nr:V-type ATP synthase subunit F [Peptoclostridium litorale]KDR94780.1 vacuolar H+-transporting two-sector ATPase, F subunit [Peptoclostridium litorale DSM 5388]SIN92535.1 V/A-type H+-transporting ATPase subunit F [Peptoclostridium litorale DSM 5388]
MKSFVISDDKDTWLAMRLAGIDGIIASEKREILKGIESAISDKNIGIIIITEAASQKVSEKISSLKLSLEYPLIVEIPSREGSLRKPDYITSYIKESIGIKI